MGPRDEKKKSLGLSLPRFGNDLDATYARKVEPKKKVSCFSGICSLFSRRRVPASHKSGSPMHGALDGVSTNPLSRI